MALARRLGYVCAGFVGLVAVLIQTQKIYYFIPAQYHVDFYSLVHHGPSYPLPDKIGDKPPRTYGQHHIRKIGSTRFAKPEMYPKQVRLSDEDRAAYFAEGYLLIRGLIPESTAAALREDYLATMGYLPYPFNENSWFMSDILLDFFAFSPMGNVVAQLFQNENVHLVYSNSNFRNGKWPAYQAHRGWHYDSIQCCQSFYPPPTMPLETNVNFQVALADMPGMHFVNNTALEWAMASVDESLVSDYHEGRMARMKPLEVERTLGRDKFNAMSQRPHLRPGDVIVHTPALMHRSPDGYGGRDSAWLLPMYAVSEARYIGVPFMTDRMCLSGVSVSHHPKEHFVEINASDVPPITEQPNTDCYPQVHPPARRKSSISLSFRTQHQAHPGTAGLEAWPVASWNWRGSFGSGPDPVSLREPDYTEVPASHVIDAA